MPDRSHVGKCGVAIPPTPASQQGESPQTRVETAQVSIRAGGQPRRGLSGGGLFARREKRGTDRRDSAGGLGYKGLRDRGHEKGQHHEAEAGLRGCGGARGATPASWATGVS